MSQRLSRLLVELETILFELPGRPRALRVLYGQDGVAEITVGTRREEGEPPLFVEIPVHLRGVLETAPSVHDLLYEDLATALRKGLEKRKKETHE